MNRTNLGKNSKSDITVAMAMSGGVDSSVSAALLKEQGYKVIGFFMKNWDDARGLKISDCPWKQDREDAMRVASKLDIPFRTLDFEEEYKEQVLDYFFAEYEKGRTPNPDILCNSKIKFGVFLDKALELGADYMATGHYARVSCHPDRPAVLSMERRDPLYIDKRYIRDSSPPGTAIRNDNGVYQLLKAVDSNKDQSYFLYRLNQEQLSRAIFPIGEYTKPEVRELAKKFNLHNHNKRDSQGVCFIGKLDLQKFLSQKIKHHPGDIVDVKGKKIGAHSGLFWYTIGQRKGINISGTGPYYVIKKDFEKNELVVSNNPEDDALYTSKISISDTSWISGAPPENSKTVKARIRYREKLSPITFKNKRNGIFEVNFSIPQWAAASGQSVVFYEGEACLGGGIING